MKVTECKVSPSIPFFDLKFQTEHGLYMHRNNDVPIVHVGCYTERDWDYVNRHSEGVILVWGGGDALRLVEEAKAGRIWKFEDHVHHVAISNFVAHSLGLCGVVYKKVPLNFSHTHRFKPRPHGKSVYIYVPSDSDEDKYGWDTAVEAVQKVGDVSLLRAGQEWEPMDMPRVYAGMFLGLRLTKHDGLANTAVELGLCGRNCVWNGDTPNALPWRDAEDVVEIIKYQRAHPCDTEETATKMRAYLDVGEEWKDTDYYRGDGDG